MYVACAVVGCVYSLPVEEKTLLYVLFGAGVGALGGIALSGAGSFFDRLLALDVTVVGTVFVAVASLVVWLWYLSSVVRGQNGSPTWVVWLFSGGYVALMLLLFFVLAAPIFF
ncbi:MAG: hypothetical protein U5J64_05515 [Halobacteriales archaeon]|nr:hypothetical protein [Halobacteriales archaeon]